MDIISVFVEICAYWGGPFHASKFWGGGGWEGIIVYVESSWYWALIEGEGEVCHTIHWAEHARFETLFCGAVMVDIESSSLYIYIYVHSFMVGKKHMRNWNLFVFLGLECLFVGTLIIHLPQTCIYISIYIFLETHVFVIFLSCNYIYMCISSTSVPPNVDAGARHDESTKFGKANRFQQSQRGRQRGRKERNRKSFLKKTRRTFLRSHPHNLG